MLDLLSFLHASIVGGRQLIVHGIAMKLFLYLIVLASALSAGSTQADEIDTDHLFAFNMGTDIGSPGEKEIQAGLLGRWARSSGTYSAVAGELSFQYTPARDFVVELSAFGTSHHIENVPGMDDRHSAAFGGLALAATYRLMNRASTGLGLAVSAEPFWARVDDESGEPVDAYGAEFIIALDTEIVADRLVGVVNLRYEPVAVRSRLDDTWSRENMLGLSGGLMQKLGGDVFAGLEARYLRKYETLGFAGFVGQALYLGPSLSISLSEQAWLTAGLSAQIAGRAVGESGTLDLTNFSRYEFRLAVGTKF